MRKVYVVGEAKHYANFIQDIEHTDNLDEADIVIFTGGEDVNPKLYGAKMHPTTYCDPKRDAYEVEIFKKIKTNQLVVGICRGSQFICVMNGGKLIQNVNNHGIFGTHPIYVYDYGVTYEITSTHHQMQYPYNLPSLDYTVKAIAYPKRSTIYEGDGINENNIMIDGEPEIVLYHKENTPRCIAIQGHPEYMRKEAPIVEYLNEFINEQLNSIKNGNN